MDKRINNINITPEWDEFLSREFTQPYFEALETKVRRAYEEGNVFPPPQKMFRAFDLCPPSQLSVVILGQDPYHTKGVADGLAFSTAQGNRVPPSLQNIFKEIAQEYGVPPSADPDLTRWALQGVLLLNTSLTVSAGAPNSHIHFGWHTFTDGVVRSISKECAHVVFLLWGNDSRRKKILIDETKHLVLESAHPSPLSAYRGFFGNGHFKKTNEYMLLHGLKEILWK